jgi:ureidoglycolate lyase
VNEIRVEPLTADAFRPFGDVIESGEVYELINSGTTKKFADLAQIDVATNGGRPCISIYRSTPYEMPLKIRMLERHPLGSQLFMPLHVEPFLVVVAPAGDTVDPSSVRAFLTNGRQGVNYRRGTWHHPLIGLRDSRDFLVVDRGGQGKNCDELFFDSPELGAYIETAVLRPQR